MERLKKKGKGVLKHSHKKKSEISQGLIARRFILINRNENQKTFDFEETVKKYVTVFTYTSCSIFSNT
ncbi:hypothetical protein L1987_83776 [Smallanthus sonchifolius]|uniref:Uncharacterized protein n=1 Tax=Smallanthus sonchifolius TaxID=185202 RepID=A0ACB8YD33_9ASTR|nr:hypothetical protein L1987_83776 [Smallanthus sonchifolius]